MSQDLHKEPFDEGTQEKLWIFEHYIKEWLPVFLAPRKPHFLNVNLCDFFAGPGKDVNGIDGSPLILLKSLPEYLDSIRRNKLSIGIHFNDLRKAKILDLQRNIEELNLPPRMAEIHVTRKTFESSFAEIYPTLSRPNTANFLFLDQNGVKNITYAIFEKIVKLKNTDFIFFISSSTLHRFKNHPDIAKHFEAGNKVETPAEYCHIHRKVLAYYKSILPPNTPYYLAPFSIKKGSNIYGLIFGSHHPLGIDKFLRQCWTVDPERGEANFDIDRDNIIEGQCSLFEGFDKPKKLLGFHLDLRAKILNREITTNKQVYTFTLENGFLSSHAREIISKMKAEKLIKNTINVSYDAWCKSEPAIEILL